MIQGGGVTEKKLNNQQTKTSRKYKYQTYRQNTGIPNTELHRNRKQESRIKNEQIRNKNTKHNDELAKIHLQVWTINTLGNETLYAGFWDVRRS